MLINLFLISLLYAYTSQSQLRTDNKQSYKMKKLPEDDFTEAFCFLNVDGIVYDILPLYDPKQDYTFQNKDKEFYLNFCKFTTQKCRKDSTFISQHYLAANETNIDDCYLLSGSNPAFPSKWRVSKNYL
jgi:hypothetical protein